MARERTGSIVERDGKLYARITYLGGDGKRHAIWRRAENRTHAKELRRQLLRELEEHGERILKGDHLTFRELVAEYEKEHVFEAEYVGDQKVAGLRSLKPVKSFLASLVKQLGHRRIKEITYTDLKNFKRDRLKNPIVIKYKDKKTGEEKTRERPRSLTSVHRELEQLRAVLNFAKREGWISKNPFEAGAALITKADETKRERILDDDEEPRLLAQCVGPRAHLRAVIICAMDGGMRRGELLRIRKQDLDFPNAVITVWRKTTKTMKPKTVGMTPRMVEELKLLSQALPDDPDVVVFGGIKEMKRSFATACRLAEIQGLHFHDLRATFTTRALEAGRSRELVQKTTGHTSDAIDIYTRINQRIARETAEALATRNRAKQG